MEQGFWDYFFENIIDYIVDAFFLLLTLVLYPVIKLFSVLLETIDFTSYYLAINFLPDNVWEIAYRVGLGECSAIVVSSIIIRLIMQAVPFVRFGK